MTDREQNMADDLIAFCKKYGFTGFVGTFRGLGTTWEVRHLEAPGHRDGVCELLRLALQGLLIDAGLIDTVESELRASVFDKNKLKTDPGEMPF